MRLIQLCVLLTISTMIYAQNEAPELITDRPDQTESPTVVPRGAFQIETGFLMANCNDDTIEKKSFAFNTTLLRYGLMDNFELRLGMDYLGEKMSFTDVDTTSSSSGPGPVYAGFKVRIAERDGWKPEIAFLGGLVLPFTAKECFRPRYSAVSFRFSFAHALSDKLSLGYNLGAEWAGETAVPGYFYTIVTGFDLSEKWGLFAEAFGVFPEEGETEHVFDAGLTCLIAPNLQFDISGGIGLNEFAPDHFLSLGLSLRLPY
ncbi:MAG: transporter [Bacteroidota bacterium]